MLFKHFSGNLLLLEHMGFNLIYGGNDLAESGKVNIAVGIKIAHAYRPCLALPVRLLHSAVGAVIIAKRLVNQQKIHIVALKLFKRLVDRCLRLVIACIANPHLCCEEDILSWYSALFTAAPTPSSFAYACAVSIER